MSQSKFYCTIHVSYCRIDSDLLNEEAAIPLNLINCNTAADYKFLMKSAWWKCHHYVIVAADEAALSPLFDAERMGRIPKIFMVEAWANLAEARTEVALKRRDAFYVFVFSDPPKINRFEELGWPRLVSVRAARSNIEVYLLWPFGHSCCPHGLKLMMLAPVSWRIGRTDRGFGPTSFFSEALHVSIARPVGNGKAFAIQRPTVCPTQDGGNENSNAWRDGHLLLANNPLFDSEPDISCLEFLATAFANEPFVFVDAEKGGNAAYSGREVNISSMRLHSSTSRKLVGDRSM